VGEGATPSSTPPTHILISSPVPLPLPALSSPPLTHNLMLAFIVLTIFPYATRDVRQGQQDSPKV
jgi:hypothetical protein